MFDSELPSEQPREVPGLGPVRADSRISAHFAALEGRTQVSRLFETGSLRMRFPRGPRCEAVILNTGGGVTGGDRIAIDVVVGPKAMAIATSQAAEKLYRSDGPAARIGVNVSLASEARLSWLPQEAILFDGAKVERSLEVDMAADASLTLAEAVVFGRTAHGEKLSSANWCDRWRVRREGKLVLAENVWLQDAITERLKHPAIGAGATAIATVVHVAPDAEARLEGVRHSLASATSIAGCSAWNGMLVARFAASELHELRADMARVVEGITGEAMPRTWSC